MMLQGTYEKVEGAATARESIPAPVLVASAYGFIWAAVLVFLLLLWRRMKRTERDLEELRSKLGTHR